MECHISHGRDALPKVLKQLKLHILWFIHTEMSMCIFILGKEYPETLEKVKCSSITWTHDNKGIFYGVSFSLNLIVVYVLS